MGKQNTVFKALSNPLLEEKNKQREDLGFVKKQKERERQRRIEKRKMEKIRDEKRARGEFDENEELREFFFYGGR